MRPEGKWAPPCAIATHTRGLGAFDNLAFETGGSGKEFLPFLPMDTELIERSGRTPPKHLAVTFTNPEPFVRGLHIPPSVDDGPPQRCTQKVHDQLAIAFHAIFAVTAPIDPELGIGRHPPEQIIRRGSDGIIAAETLIERLCYSFSHGRPPRVRAKALLRIGTTGAIMLYSAGQHKR